MAFRALLSQVKPAVGSAFTALQHSSILSRSPRASNSSIGSRMRSMGKSSFSERTRSVEEESHRHSIQDSPEMIEWEEAERRRLIAEMDQRYIKERQLKEKSMEPIKELLREVTSRLSVLSARLSRNRTNRPASAGDATLYNSKTSHPAGSLQRLEQLMQLGNRMPYRRMLGRNRSNTLVEPMKNAAGGNWRKSFLSSGLSPGGRGRARALQHPAWSHELETSVLKEVVGQVGGSRPLSRASSDPATSHLDRTLDVLGMPRKRTTARGSKDQWRNSLLAAVPSPKVRSHADRGKVAEHGVLSPSYRRTPKEVTKTSMIPTATKLPLTPVGCRRPAAGHKELATADTFADSPEKVQGRNNEHQFTGTDTGLGGTVNPDVKPINREVLQEPDVMEFGAGVVRESTLLMPEDMAGSNFSHWSGHFVALPPRRRHRRRCRRRSEQRSDSEVTGQEARLAARRTLPASAQRLMGQRMLSQNAITQLEEELVRMEASALDQFTQALTRQTYSWSGKWVPIPKGMYTYTRWNLELMGMEMFSSRIGSTFTSSYFPYLPVVQPESAESD